jgi:hypothetical protein
VENVRCPFWGRRMIAFMKDRPRTRCRVCNSYPCMDGTGCEGNPPSGYEIVLTRGNGISDTFLRAAELSREVDKIVRHARYRLNATPRSPKPRIRKR